MREPRSVTDEGGADSRVTVIPLFRALFPSPPFALLTPTASRPHCIANGFLFANGLLPPDRFRKLTPPTRRVTGLRGTTEPSPY